MTFSPFFFWLLAGSLPWTKDDIPETPVSADAVSPLSPLTLIVMTLQHMSIFLPGRRLIQLKHGFTRADLGRCQ